MNKVATADCKDRADAHAKPFASTHVKRQLLIAGSVANKQGGAKFLDVVNVVGTPFALSASSGMGCHCCCHASVMPTLIGS